MTIQELFHKFSAKTSEMVGSPGAFCGAAAIVLVWAGCGPIAHFSETWQLVINTGTTIITFLMVFLIQNTQNRDSKVIHLKLDELIRSQEGARNDLIDLEDLSEEELQRLAREFAEIRKKDCSMHQSLDKVEDILNSHRKKSGKKQSKHGKPTRKTNDVD